MDNRPHSNFDGKSGNRIFIDTKGKVVLKVFLNKKIRMKEQGTLPST